jgi:hypothetical protein
MAKYLLLKHYRGGPAPSRGPRRWTIGRGTRSTQTCSSCTISRPGWRRRASSSTPKALAPDGAFVWYDDEGRPPVTDGPFVETKDLIAGWYIIDVESWDRAVQLAGELSAAPGPGGKPIYEWLEVRPFLADSPTVTE